MTLFLNNFYTIQNNSAEENKLTFNVKINSEHEIFKGHFPGQPITPGVVQMEMLKELTEQFLGKSIQLKSMPNCKFLAILNPNEIDILNIELEIKEQTDQQIRINAILKSKDVIYTKSSFIYMIN